MLIQVQAFYVRDRRFFQEGRVFAVLFSQTGPSATDYNTSRSIVRYHNRNIRSSRRFVVVRVKREFCFACPIFTYSGRATTKAGVRASEHGIVFSEGQKPQLLPGEAGIVKPSIAVSTASGELKLPVASRIYYGIHHPIQYNIKVKDIGQVLPSHVPSLIGNWKAEDNGETQQAPEVTAEAASANPEQDYDEDDDDVSEEEDEEEEEEEEQEEEEEEPEEEAAGGYGKNKAIRTGYGYYAR